MRVSLFFRLRVSVLLAALVGVALWAWRDVRSRRERTLWLRPLSVAVVLTRLGAVDADAVESFREGLPKLEARLASERGRYALDAPRPFRLTFVGPVDVAEGPPKPPSSSLWDLGRQTWALSRWTRAIDRATHLDRGAFDSRIYVSARRPQRTERAWVEGESEQGGRIGAVEVELTASMVDLALCVVAHELFHTLGASDKYDVAGRTLFPEGFVEPDRVPLLPQPFADVMTRNRPVAPADEVPPESLDELAVGPATAREIGWVQ